MENKELKFDRLPETLAQVGLGKTQLYALVARGEFPRPICLSGRAVAWERGQVQEWMRARMEGGRRTTTTRCKRMKSGS